MDGKKDMVLGGWYSDVRLYSNMGTNTNPIFTSFVYLVRPDSQNYLNGNPPRVAFADWDGDGDQDMLTCDYYGSVFLRRNITPTTVEEHKNQVVTKSELSITPNPTQGRVLIRCMIQNARYRIGEDRSQKREASIRIFDVSGSVVADLSDNLASDILHNTSVIPWDCTADDGKKLASGVYIVVLKANTEVQSQKLSIVR